MPKKINEWPEWPNARDWIGIGTFALTIMLLWMVKSDKQLLENEFFKNISLLIIGTGYVNGAVAWAYSTSKTGTELAPSNAKTVEQMSDKAEPQKVVVEQPANKPVPTKDVEPGPEEEHDGSWMQPK